MFSVQKIYAIILLSIFFFSYSFSLKKAGFRWDRLWTVLNSNGKAYTQRVLPKLALVQVELPAEAFSDDWEPNNSSFLGNLNHLMAVLPFIFIINVHVFLFRQLLRLLV